MSKMKEKYTQEKFDALWKEMEALDKVYEYDGTGNPQEAAAKQVGGTHYKDMKIPPTEYILANNVPWLEANAIKYISRHKTKNGLEDILKAIHYLELLIKKEYND